MKKGGETAISNQSSLFRGKAWQRQGGGNFLTKCIVEKIEVVRETSQSEKTLLRMWDIEGAHLQSHDL